MGGDGMVEVIGQNALSTAPAITHLRATSGTATRDGGDAIRTSRCPREIFERGSRRGRSETVRLPPDRAEQGVAPRMRRAVPPIGGQIQWSR